MACPSMGKYRATVCPMLCSDTGSTEAVRVDMTVAEAQRIGNAFKVIREYPNGHGNGEVCIPLVSGFVKKLRVAFEDFIDQKRH
jgi:hypothetical protein